MGITSFYLNVLSNICNLKHIKTKSINKMWINLSRIILQVTLSLYIRAMFFGNNCSNYSRIWELGLAVTGKKFITWYHLGKALFPDYIVSSAKLAASDPVIAF